MNKVLISYAKGFLGSVLCKELMASVFEVKVKVCQLPLTVETPEVRKFDIIGKTSWSKVLEEIEIDKINQVNGQKGRNTATMRFFAG